MTILKNFAFKVEEKYLYWKLKKFKLIMRNPKRIPKNTIMTQNAAVNIVKKQDNFMKKTIVVNMTGDL